MKKKMLRTFAIGLAVCSALTFFSLAAEKPETSTDKQASKTSTESLDVRVNGHLMSFPDGQPYLDVNGRTMVPVRFVAEELSANVSWDPVTKTAIIEREAIRIDIPIGSKIIKVTEGNKVQEVEMNTQAVETEGRTYVPIRYVAEALGAHVDYADAFNTVGIYYNPEFLAENIKFLREFDYTLPEIYTTYSEAKLDRRYDEEDLVFFFGTKRESFVNSFENAHTYLYDNNVCTAFTYYFDHLGFSKKPKNVEEYYDLLLKEAIAELSYKSDNLTVTFESDNALMYHPDNMKFLNTTIRGVLTVESKVFAKDFTYEERCLNLYTRFGISRIAPNEPVYMAIDVHMGQYANGRIIVDTIVPLCGLEIQ